MNWKNLWPAGSSPTGPISPQGGVGWGQWHQLSLVTSEGSAMLLPLPQPQTQPSLVLLLVREALSRPQTLGLNCGLKRGQDPHLPYPGPGSKPLSISTLCKKNWRLRQNGCLWEGSGRTRPLRVPAPSLAQLSHFSGPLFPRPYNETAHSQNSRKSEQENARGRSGVIHFRMAIRVWC